MIWKRGKLVPAKFDRVVDTRLCTLVANDHGARIGTIEHLMAALRGLGIDNVLVELDAAEVPVMDGSSRPFIDAIDVVLLTFGTKADLCGAAGRGIWGHLSDRSGSYVKRLVARVD